MIFEPESWTGLRSSEAVAHGFDEANSAPEAPPRAQRSALRSVVTRIGAFVDRTAGREADPYRIGGGRTSEADFLRERRLFVSDALRR